jgi:rhodanese-related sulfurtransferase
MDFLDIIIAVVGGIIVGYIVIRFMNIDRSKIHVLSVEDFTSNMRKGQLVDVRKADKYEENKIKGARNFKKRQITGKYSKLRKDQSVYLYCQNGRKSMRIAKAMSRDSYSDIYVLSGGLNSYLETHK